MPLIDADFDQVHLLPPTLEEWIDDAHPARFIRAFVDQLDLRQLGISTRDVSTPGRPAYAPALLMRVWLYGYFEKVRSSRKLEAACRGNIGFIWLSGTHAPDHNTLWRFWNGNRKALRELFKQSVLTSCRMGLVGLVTQALDGTKIQAACHAGKAYDAADLAKRVDRLDDGIRELERSIEQEQAGGGEPSADLPGKLRGKRRLKEAVEKARAELAGHPGTSHIHPLERDARRVKTKGGKPFGCNGQAVVDEDHQIIVADPVESPHSDACQGVAP